MARPVVHRERTRLYEAPSSSYTVHDEESSRHESADISIDGFIVGAMAVATIPSPYIDLAAISGVQLSMLSYLCRRYEVPFTNTIGRAVISSLVSGSTSTWLGMGIVTSMLKAVPIVGSLYGAVAMPLWAGATTYALATVFREHLERGGNLHDFDADGARKDYEKAVKAGREVAGSVKH